MEPWYQEYLSQDLIVQYVGGSVYIRAALAFVLGVCVGSFSNVVALRSLLHRSWISPRSHCLHCDHKLAPFDMIPILSYFLLGKKCRYCKETIAWQYPVVEAFTGLIFVVILVKFGFSIDGLAMCFFAATMITVTITDFREKLIPHEITYPAIIIGLIYFAVRHGNIADALIGAGASYILFDFIDFYGLVAITHLKDDEDDAPSRGASPWVIDHSYDAIEPEYNPDDDIVMGGGDAVMSALIGCWLGWQQMAIAVTIAFLIGSLMGAGYLLFDMQRRDVLKNAIKPAILGFIGGFSVLAAPLLTLGYLTKNQDLFLTPQLMGLASLAGVAGALLGAVMTGTRRFSNRFPFGPALAAGGLVALLVTPESWYWTQPMGIIYQGGGLR